MKKGSFSALAKKAASSVNYSMESMNKENAKFYLVAGGVFAAATAVATGYNPIMEMYEANQAGQLLGDDLINTFKDHMHDVLTLNGGQNTLTGVGIYAVVGAAVADYGSTLLSNVNRMANKFFPEVYNMRIDTAAQNVANVFKELKKQGDINLQDVVENSSIYRYIAGVDGVKDTASIFSKAANILKNAELVDKIEADMTFHPSSVRPS
jgi:hypothetical protein